MAGVLEFTQANFEQEVLQSPGTVLVDFSSPTCGPCRKLLPILKELAAENSGVAKIGTLNADDDRDLALRYRVDALPTLIVFKDGQPVQQFRGLQSKVRLQDAINSAKA